MDGEETRPQRRPVARDPVAGLIAASRVLGVGPMFDVAKDVGPVGAQPVTQRVVLADIIGTTTHAILGRDRLSSGFGGFPFEAAHGPTWPSSAHPHWRHAAAIAARTTLLDVHGPHHQRTHGRHTNEFHAVYGLPARLEIALTAAPS